MDVGSIIRKIENGNEPRELYDVPIAICSEGAELDVLARGAETYDIVNQLGALVDLTLENILPREHPRYKALQSLSDNLYDRRKEGTQAFYKTGHPDLVLEVEKSMERMNDPETNRILKKWGLVAVLSPDKFKQAYNQNGHRQTTTGSHSPSN